MNPMTGKFQGWFEISTALAAGAAVFNRRIYAALVLPLCCLAISCNDPVIYDDSLQIPAMWEYTGPLISPVNRSENRSFSQKDPSVVFHAGKWHVFMTIKLQGATRIEYTSFDRWENADSAPRTVLNLADSDYYAAPQVFYFTPHRKWYLIYQAGVPGGKYMQISFSTTPDIGDPGSWSRAESVFRADEEDPRTEGGLDYWVICDDQRAYLFYTNMKGKLWRMWTPLASFPYGFGHPEVALQADIFEASHTYRVDGLDKYLTIVEARKGGRRYYKAYTASTLDGNWLPVADSWKKPFAGNSNIRPSRSTSNWTDNISHGELVRAANDQTIPVNPDKLQLVFQGALETEKAGTGYRRIPWRIGILNPIVPDPEK